MEMVLSSNKSNGFLARKAIYAVFSGVIGTLVLAAFGAVIMDVHRVAKYLPWMIGFNTAMTGFSLLDKADRLITRRHLAAAAAGIASVGITLAALTLLSNYFAGENLIGLSRWGLCFAIGAACGAFGGWLAMKAHQHKEE
jgi:hypothetical protein